MLNKSQVSHWPAVLVDRLQEVFGARLLLVVSHGELGNGRCERAKLTLIVMLSWTRVHAGGYRNDRASSAR